MDIPVSYDSLLAQLWAVDTDVSCVIALPLPVDLNTFMVNHVMHCVSVVLHHRDVIERCNTNSDLMCVSYPWNDWGHVYTDIPPHVVTLQELTLLREDQKNLIDNFVSKVKVALQEHIIDNERLMVENLNWILDTFRNELNAQLQTIGNAHQGGAVPAEHVENG